MVYMQTWNIYTRKGQYLGQYRAFAPETAVCMHLAVSGRTVRESDLACIPLSDTIQQVTLDREQFFLSQMPPSRTPQQMSS